MESSFSPLNTHQDIKRIELHRALATAIDIIIHIPHMSSSTIHAWPLSLVPPQKKSNCLHSTIKMRPYSRKLHHKIRPTTGASSDVVVATVALPTEPFVQVLNIMKPGDPAGASALPYAFNLIDAGSEGVQRALHAMVQQQLTTIGKGQLVTAEGVTPPPLRLIGGESGADLLQWVEQYASLLHLVCVANTLNPAARCLLGIDTLAPIQRPNSKTATTVQFVAMCQNSFDVTVAELMNVIGKVPSSSANGARLSSSGSWAQGIDALLNAAASPSTSNQTLPSTAQHIGAILVAVFGNFVGGEASSGQIIPISRYLSGLLTLNKKFGGLDAFGATKPASVGAAGQYALAMNSVFHSRLSSVQTFADEAVLTLFQIACSLATVAVATTKHALSPSVVRVGILLHHRAQQDASAADACRKAMLSTAAPIPHPLDPLVMATAGLELQENHSICHRSGGPSSGFFVAGHVASALLAVEEGGAPTPNAGIIQEFRKTIIPARPWCPLPPMNTTNQNGYHDLWVHQLAGLPPAETGPIFTLPALSQLRSVTSKLQLKRGVSALALPVAKEYNPKKGVPPTATPAGAPPIVVATKAANRALSVAGDVLLVMERLIEGLPRQHLTVDIPYLVRRRLVCRLHGAVNKYAYAFYSLMPAALSNSVPKGTAPDPAASNPLLHDVHTHREAMLGKIALRGAKEALGQLHEHLTSSAQPSRAWNEGGKNTELSLAIGAGLLFCVGLLHTSSYFYHYVKPAPLSLFPHALPAILLATELANKLSELGGEFGREGLVGAVFPLEFVDGLLIPEACRLASILTEENNAVYHNTLSPQLVDLLDGIRRATLPVDDAMAVVTLLCNTVQEAVTNGVVPVSWLRSSALSEFDKGGGGDTVTPEGAALVAAVERILLDANRTVAFPGTLPSAIDIRQGLQCFVANGSPSSAAGPKEFDVGRSLFEWIAGPSCSGPVDIAKLDELIQSTLASIVNENSDKGKGEQTGETVQAQGHMHDGWDRDGAPSRDNCAPSVAILHHGTPLVRPIPTGGKRGREEDCPLTTSHPHQPNRGDDALVDACTQPEAPGAASAGRGGAKVGGGLMNRLRAVAPSATAEPQLPPPPSSSAGGSKATVSQGLLNRIREQSKRAE